ncbi:Alpha/Beta hydrolase protein [Mycena epipterygia]|nr:Alpha/Beta hydrolase protein [Mycena epipterygia]
MLILVAVMVIDMGATPVIDLGDLIRSSTTQSLTASPKRLGNLHFRAPQPPKNVTGVQQATTQLNQCFQASDRGSATNPLRACNLDIVTSEDYLFLSVYFPSDTEGALVSPLPTIVFIHSRGCLIIQSPNAPPYLGSYLGGAASMYWGTDLLNQSNRGVVVVIIQYRLGVFRFLPRAEIKKKGALNAGLFDQDFALQWVNKHISQFIGDPSKVTIWGESTGASSMLQHVVANNGQTKPQLFRAAMTSSTFLPSQYKYNDCIPELLYSKVVADKEALLTITNSFKGTIFVNQSTEATANATQYALNLFPNFRPAQANRVGTLYAGLGMPLFQTNVVYGESILICPTYVMLHAFAGHAFKGEFAIPPGMHGTDILYYFPSIPLDFPKLSFLTFENTAFIDAFAQTFTVFAMWLNPNIKVYPPSITPQWNKWGLGETEMLFNKADTDIPLIKVVKTSDALLEHCSGIVLGALLASEAMTYN